LNGFTHPTPSTVIVGTTGVYRVVFDVSAVGPNQFALTLNDASLIVDRLA